MHANYEVKIPSNVTIHVTLQAGVIEDDFFNGMVSIADQLGCFVMTEVNGATIVAKPGDDPKELLLAMRKGAKLGQKFIVFELTRLEDA